MEHNLQILYYQLVSRSVEIWVCADVRNVNSLSVDIKYITNVHLEREDSCILAASKQIN